MRITIITEIDVEDLDEATEAAERILDAYNASMRAADGVLYGGWPVATLVEVQADFDSDEEEESAESAWLLCRYCGRDIESTVDAGFQDETGSEQCPVAGDHAP